MTIVVNRGWPDNAATMSNIGRTLASAKPESIDATAARADATTSAELPRARTTETKLRIVTPGYFRAMGIPLRAGREFTGQERRGDPGLILVNEALARAYFQGE